MNHFSAASLRRRVAQHFNVISSHPANRYLMMISAEKSFTAQLDNSSALAHEAQAGAHLEPQSSQQLQTPPPLVSICITTYNHAGPIKKSIDSALQQTYPNVEVIVVDDGSTDSTRRILEAPLAQPIAASGQPPDE